MDNFNVWNACVPSVAIFLIGHFLNRGRKFSFLVLLPLVLTLPWILIPLWNWWTATLAFHFFFTVVSYLGYMELCFCTYPRMARWKQFFLILLACGANQVYFSLLTVFKLNSHSLTWFIGFFPGMLMVLMGLYLHTKHVSKQAKSIFGREEIGFNNFWVNLLLLQCFAATYASSQTFSEMYFFFAGAGFAQYSFIAQISFQMMIMVVYNVWLLSLEKIALITVGKLMCSPTTRRKIHHVCLLVMETFFYVFYRNLFFKVDQPLIFIGMQLWQVAMTIISYPFKMTLIRNAAIHFIGCLVKTRSLAEAWEQTRMWIQRGEHKKVIDQIIENLSSKHYCRILAENISIFNFCLGLTLIRLSLLGRNSDYVPLVNDMSQQKYEALMWYSVFMFLIEIAKEEVIWVIVHFVWRVNMMRLGRSVFKDVRMRLVAGLNCAHVAMSIYFALINFNFPQPDLFTSIFASAASGALFLVLLVLYLMIDRLWPSNVYNKTKLKDEYATVHQTLRIFNSVLQVIDVRKTMEEDLDLDFLVHPDEDIEETNKYSSLEELPTQGVSTTKVPDDEEGDDPWY